VRFYQNRGRSETKQAGTSNLGGLSISAYSARTPSRITIRSDTFDLNKADGRVAIPAVNAPDLQKEAAKRKA